MMPARSAGVGEFSLPRTIPLDEAQLERLRTLVKEDPEAAGLFNILEAEASKSLGVTPTPVKEIEYEGLVNTDPRRIESVEKISQMRDAAILLGYWQAGGEEKAAATLRELVSAWADTYVPTGNDVNENKLYPLFVAYEALRMTFPVKEREMIDAWIAQMGEKHVRALTKSTELTNRFTKSLRMVAIFGRILDKADWSDQWRKNFKKYVTLSLRPDGGSEDLERRDTLTYHSSGLRPLIELAIIAGEDAGLYGWEAPGGASVRRSVEYVVPYADGSKTRKEWLNTKIELDRKRAAAGIEEYRAGRLYEPKDALHLLEEAAFFDAGLDPLVRKLSGSENSRFSTWTMVVNAAAR